MSLPDDLSLAAYARLSHAERLSLGEHVARVTGGFSRTGELVGSAGLVELLDGAHGVRFALVPGGRCTLGFRPEEVEAMRAAFGVREGGPYAEAFERLVRSAPPREIEVAPFLCAQAPLLDIQIELVDPRLIGRCPLRYEPPFPDLEEPHTGDDDEDEEEDDGARYLPSFLTIEECRRACGALGLRTLTGEEWEYVAREGGARSFIGADRCRYGDVVAPIDALHELPAFLPARPRPKAIALATNGLGVWGLHLGEWVGEAGSGGRTRGGAVMSWPFQDSPEALWAHPAFERDGGALPPLSAVRLAVPLRG